MTWKRVLAIITGGALVCSLALYYQLHKEPFNLNAALFEAGCIGLCLGMAYTVLVVGDTYD